MIWLKIGCVITFIAVMVGLKFGLVAVAGWGGPDFVNGALFGGAFIGVCFWIASAIDRRDQAEKD